MCLYSQNGLVDEAFGGYRLCSEASDVYAIERRKSDIRWTTSEVFPPKISAV